MKLRTGMWVVTNDRLHIGKIKDFCTCDSCKERGFYEPIIDNPNIFITNYDKECKFHGYKFYDNIIDLIQIGDYVNGLPVIHNAKNNGGNIIIVVNGNAYTELEIRDIVTKEQFESVKYNID